MKTNPLIESVLSYWEVEWNEDWMDDSGIGIYNNDW